MAIEIEKKFLVNNDFTRFATDSERITQGYLCSAPERTVRVRIKGNRGFITVKGPSNKSGASRYEWEKEISIHDATNLLELCEPGVIDKIRFYVPVGGHLFEVDVFHGDNEGLIVAEIELNAEDEAFEQPVWLGTEVTGDPKYYNAALMKNPFNQWETR